MRGIETGKVRIRHEVFTEIARMAYAVSYTHLTLPTNSLV